MAFSLRNKLIFAVILLLFILSSPVSSLFAESSYLIDTPTKGMLDYGNYNVDFRFFNGGGILSKLTFGVFKMVNLGVGWEVDQLIGTQTPQAAPPSLYIKIKPFNGGMVLPAFAFGYDGQGYYYNKTINQYQEKEKGIFIVFGREILVPGLNANVGANMNDFSQNTVYGFLNLEYEIEEGFRLLAEYDNISYFPQARLNLGIRFYVSEDISIDLADRDMGSNQGPAERIIKIGYNGKF